MFNLKLHTLHQSNAQLFAFFTINIFAKDPTFVEKLKIAVSFVSVQVDYFILK
jgi:hypothetical protein